MYTIAYDKALEIAENLINKLEKEYDMKCYIVGSIRRKEHIVHDIDLITSDKLIDDDNKKFIKFIYKSIPVNIWRTDDIQFTRIMRTFDKNDNIVIRSVAKHRGYLLNDYGLFKNGIKIPISNKKKLLKMLNIHHIK